MILYAAVFVNLTGFENLLGLNIPLSIASIKEKIPQ